MKKLLSISNKRKSIFFNLLITAIFLALGILLSSLLLIADPNGGFVSMIFVLMVVLIARLTDGYLYGAVASFISVTCVNYIFTYPYWEFNFTIAGYPLTFLTMLSVSLTISAMTSQIKQQEQMRIESERETMRANLLRAVSHDLRTPVDLLPSIFSIGTRQITRDSDSRRNMGIGLSVCYSIVQAHNGIMRAENIPDGGSEFSFTLPLGEEQFLMEDLPYEDS